MVTFDVATSIVSLPVTITEMHAATVIVTISYLLFDATAFSLSLYENLIFDPKQVKANLLVGIGKVTTLTNKTANNNSVSNSTRRLAAQPYGTSPNPATPQTPN